MKLSPLPTTILANKKKNENAFPYKEISLAKQVDPSDEAPVLSPFLKTQTPQNDQQKQGNSEAQRMSELENMLNEAQSRTAVVEQEAYDKAYAAGEKSGLALGEKRAEQNLEAMQKIVDLAEEELKQLKENAVDVVIDIAKAVVTHVMGDSKESLEQILENAVKQTFEQFLVGSNTDIILAVNPEDLSMFMRMKELPAESKIRAHQDVKAGTCKLVSQDQDILIDPKQAIEDAASFVRERLLNHG